MRGGARKVVKVIHPCPSLHTSPHLYRHPHTRNTVTTPDPSPTLLGFSVKDCLAGGRDSSLGQDDQKEGSSKGER